MFSHCYSQSPLQTNFAPPLSLEQKRLKLVFKINSVYRNLKSENSQDYAQKSCPETKLYVHEFGFWAFIIFRHYNVAFFCLKERREEIMRPSVELCAATGSLTKLTCNATTSCLPKQEEDWVDATKCTDPPCWLCSYRRRGTVSASWENILFYGPPGYIGWRASTRTLCRSWQYPPVRDYEFGLRQETDALIRLFNEIGPWSFFHVIISLYAVNTLYTVAKNFFIMLKRSQ